MEHKILRDAESRVKYNYLIVFQLIQTAISSLNAKMEASERRSREMYRRMIGQEAVPKQEDVPKQEAVPEPAPKKVNYT